MCGYAAVWLCRYLAVPDVVGSELDWIIVPVGIGEVQNHPHNTPLAHRTTQQHAVSAQAPLHADISQCRLCLMSTDSCDILKELSSCQRLQVQALEREAACIMSAASTGVRDVPICCLWYAYRVLCMYQVVCCHEGFIWAPLATCQVQHVGTPLSASQGHLNSHNKKHHVD